VNGDNGNGKGRFDWRVVAVSVGLILAQGFIQYGIMSAIVTDHSRRLELLERRIEERSVARDEYERRHEDLRNEVKDMKNNLEEDRRAIRELEKKVR
jgi:chromosome segregation ATPase